MSVFELFEALGAQWCLSSQVFYHDIHCKDYFYVFLNDSHLHSV
jgi:hypothetical protein